MALLFTGSTTPADAGSEKPAWAWTLEERLAKRTDPQEIAARAHSKSPQNQLNVIDGKWNPELFLPTELFDALLEDGFPPAGSDPRESRRRINEVAVALGLGNDLWPRIERVASSYLALRKDYEQLAHSRGNGDLQRAAAIKKSQLAMCRARAEALNAAKAELGEEAFLRLLYEGLAANMGIEIPVQEGQRELWRAREEGCR